MTEHPSTDHIALVGKLVNVCRIIVVDSKRPWLFNLASRLKRIARVKWVENLAQRNSPISRTLVAGLLEFQSSDKKLATALFQDADNFRLVVRRLGPDQFGILLETMPAVNSEERVHLDAATIERFDWLADKAIRIEFGPK